MPQIIVIGAGWAGLAAARVFLDVHPSTDLLILEAGNGVGGTWSTERVYSRLATHSTLGLFEFPGYPMPGTRESHYLQGARVADYLENFARTTGISKHLKLNSKVAKVIRAPDNQWHIFIEGSNECYYCEKLIVATGLTSVPYIPSTLNPTSGIQILHSKDLAKAESLIRSPHSRDFVVYGGSKSAFDAVYSIASEGKKVHWIVREDEIGHGVSAQSIPKIPFLDLKLIELTSTRFVSSFSPCVYQPDGLWCKFLYRTSVGKALLDVTWKVLDFMVKFNSGFSCSENGRKLRPKAHGWMFWCFGHIGIMTQEKFWHEIHHNANITVHRSSITNLEENRVVLANGENLQADILFACTGWKGESFSISYPSSSGDEHWVDGSNEPSLRAKHHIIERFPILEGADEYRNGPEFGRFNLYRSIAPADMVTRGDNSLVYIGMPQTAQTPMLSWVQALWATAYLSGDLTLPSQTNVMADMHKLRAWFSQRYPGVGAASPFAIYDHLAFIDTWLSDLGLLSRRKSWWLGEWFSVYRPADYAGIVKEWVHKQRKDI